MKTRLLITGASGFIGRNLFEYFSKKENMEVFGTYKSRLLASSTHMCQYDLTREDEARNLFEKVRPHVLIHTAAATAGFHEFKKNEGAFIHANVLMNMHMIALSAEYNIAHVVLPSCSLVYPSSNSTVGEEDTVIYPLEHPYSGGAKVKHIMEDLAWQFSHVSGGRTAYIMVRHSNIYGPYDKFYGSGHLVASKIAEIVDAEDGSTITIRGHGEERRDLLHVDDLVRFVESAIHRENPHTDVWNVGSGSVFPVNEIVRKIINASGKRLTCVNDLAIPSAPTQPALNCQKAKSDFGWEPNINLDDGIRMAMEWYKAHKHIVSTL
ncbi:MAG: UDP-glucose 4-epimerase [Parcubacteria group bacterium Gr01-1014_70]|nr:MAG: UDP-glucose 4-epimerase [Parcubacteria group bacterium Gr01-1014_70]